MENELLMEEAFKQALLAYDIGDIPVGAIVVDQNGNIIGKGYNRKEIDNSVISHAEINAINEASKKIMNWRLNNCIMFVTLEPCDMCRSVINESRIKKIYYCMDNKKKCNINFYCDYEKIINSNINDKYKKLFNKTFEMLRNKDN
jgi:tRNA(adenine34) deaminase